MTQNAREQKARWVFFGLNGFIMSYFDGSDQIAPCFMVASPLTKSDMQVSLPI